MKKSAPAVNDKYLQIKPVRAGKKTKRAYSTHSPLRYPGGKTRGVVAITQYFPENLDHLLSPFFGGGSIELSVAAKGTRVYGYDVFSPLVEFWQGLLKEPVAMAKKIEIYYPLSKILFYALQHTQTQFKTKLERAAVYYVLNRCSFSGSTLSGGMSPEHPRFTPASIEKIKAFYNPNIVIRKADFKQSLEAHPSVFTYLDPPYLIRSALYGKKGNAHKDFDHKGLAAILRKRKYWLLSYNDCAEIRQLYNGFEMICPNWKYGMSSNKASSEILIFSKDFKAGKFHKK